jgi:fluoride ion exporter CrcB/FEX
MEPIIILLFVGALGGVVRAFLGYQVQSEKDEKFNVIKLASSVLRAMIAGSLLVYNTTDVASIHGTQTYVGAFFTSIGADVFLKELYGTVTGK